MQYKLTVTVATSWIRAFNMFYKLKLICGYVCRPLHVLVAAFVVR